MTCASPRPTSSHKRFIAWAATLIAVAPGCGVTTDEARTNTARGSVLLDTGSAALEVPATQQMVWGSVQAVTEVSKRPGQHHATIARGANGETALAWDEFGEPKSAWFGVYDAQGAALIDPIWLRDCDGTGPCRFDVEASGDGYWLSGSDSQGIWLMAVDARGQVVLEPYLLDVATPGTSLEAPDIAVRDDGGLLVVWVRRDESSDVFAGEYATVWVDPSGVPEGTPQTLGASPGGLSVPDAVANAYGGAQVAWFERQQDSEVGRLHLSEWFWPGVFWGDTVIAEGSSVVEPRVMLDAAADGTLAVSWRASLDDDRYAARVRLRNPDRVWGAELDMQVGEWVDKPMVSAVGDRAFVSWDDVGGVDMPGRNIIWWQAIDLETMHPLGEPAPITDGSAAQTRSAMDVGLEDGEAVLSVAWSSKRFPKVARQIKFITGSLQPASEAPPDDAER